MSPASQMTAMSIGTIERLVKKKKNHLRLNTGRILSM
jgi:hypothetical protein